MLLTKVLHRIFVPFCVNFRPSVPPKSRFSLEKVVDFEVFRTFLPSTLFNTFSPPILDPLGLILGALGALLGAS